MLVRTTPVTAAPGLRIGDYRIHRGMVTLRRTGNAVPFDRRLAAEVLGWLRFQAVVALRRLTRPGSGLSIWFAPEVPHPRYMVRAAALWAGIRVARTPDAADSAFYFADATHGDRLAAPHPRSFNFGCNDISKSHVATVFEQVFGYALTVDPRRHVGEAVEKGEGNGAHDGRIIACPCEPVPGKCYQRVIDNVADDGLVVDLRTAMIGGRAVAVWVKRRPVAARFLAPNTSVRRHAPDAVFSAAELDRLGAFSRAMGADWCSLDVLRDRDGRIYVVDVNKTDAGPIVALSLREQLVAVALLAAALTALIGGDL